MEQDEEDAALLRYVNASVGGMQPNADKPLPDVDRISAAAALPHGRETLAC